MVLLQHIIAFLIIYLCVYALISRICQCVEYCAIAKAYCRYLEQDSTVNVSDIKEKIKNVDQRIDKK